MQKGEGKVRIKTTEIDGIQHEADSVTGKPTLMMCPPDYYGIEYEINPWMDRQHPAKIRLARQQWEQLRTTLVEQAAVRVLNVEPAPGLPDMVFTANAGLVHENRAILSNFRYAQRQGEATHFRQWFESHGYPVETLPAKYAFEGEGDALFVGNDLFVGYRFRTDAHAHRLIGEMLGLQVISLHLTDPYFYHLDTCLCPLGPEIAAYYPPAFDTYAQQVLKANIPRLVEISDHDAHRFAANAIVVGNRVVMNAGCDAFRRELQAEGFEVYPVDLSQFLLAGGSAKCLVLHVPAG